MPPAAAPVSNSVSPTNAVSQAKLWSAVGLAVALLVAHKPWALHTPQLYAEDGSIFLQQDDDWGARAFLAPYMGYLHFLPRLVAWLARVSVDVAWWPAVYNGAAFLVTVGVLARFASPRLEIPGKPWLALAVVLVPHTGEVLFTITNVQWLTAFLLLQQLLIARPATATQRIGDLILTLVAGFTGPFAVLLLPLFAWRWWRERHVDNLVLLLAVGLCAAVQGRFILQAGQPSVVVASGFHPGMFLAVLGARLVAWPFLGPQLARALPTPALAALGALILGALALWVLRPHPRRALRARILAALALVAAACVYRLRPDTWASANLENGDRYFFIPRVLLAWLVIWEFDATPRTVAYVARALALALVLLELPQHRLPAPPDYHWAEHCDPIRRGTPANIYTLPEGWWIEYPGRSHKR